MKVTLLKEHKSLPKGLVFDLSNFCILTGINGSGKTHLLEAMASRSLSDIRDGDQIFQKALYLPYAKLVPELAPVARNESLREVADNFWGEISDVLAQYKNGNVNPEVVNADVAKYLAEHHQLSQWTMESLLSILDRTGFTLGDLSFEHVLDNLDYSIGSSLFTSRLGLVFKSYQKRFIDNSFNEYRALNGIPGARSYLDAETFGRIYGPPPWVLLNQVLSDAGFSYEFADPLNDDVEAQLDVRLISKEGNYSISADDLSSGEKVILSLVLAVYNSTDGSGLPELLLMDEPDAPLHPSYSKLLIDTLADSLVRVAGIKVVFSTHSPTTVALAPDGCIYEVNQKTRIPEFVSNLKAVAGLSQGLDYLRISLERRRTVFVESKYDVLYFETLFSVLNKGGRYKFQPVFLAPHNREGSNCKDVQDIVSNLIGSGSDSIWGVIDFDNYNISTDRVFVLGEGRRYAVENYLLDPLFVVLALVRAGKVSFAEFGLVGSLSMYTDASELSEGDCQVLVDGFFSKVGIVLTDMQAVELENGYKLLYPSEFLRLKGHDYEALIRIKIPQLGAVVKGQGDSGLKLGVLTSIQEWPRFLPVDVGELFMRLDS